MENPDLLTRIDMKYLQYIHEIPTGNIVSPTLVARRFRISRVSAMERLRRLAHKGYGDYVVRKGFLLNGNGAEAVEHHIRKHRILECMLTLDLGVNLENVCEEASTFDHYLSDMLVEKMDERLGHPTTCPCGKAIPGLRYGKGRP